MKSPSSCSLRSKNPYVVEKYCPFSPFLWEEITWTLMFSILAIISRSRTFAVVLQVSGSWFASHAHGQRWRFSKVQSNLFTGCWICECHLLIHVDQICDVKLALLFWNGFSSKEYLHFCLFCQFTGLWSHKLLSVLPIYRVLESQTHCHGVQDFWLVLLKHSLWYFTVPKWVN